ncbi:VCBS repeat-containing protein [Isosphaeraceae bacterium EP7]
MRRALSLMTLAAAAFAGPADAAEPKWKKHDVNASSPYEAAGVFDVDNDGKLDIVSGAFWYKAPDWAKFPVRDVAKMGTYYNCFSTLPMDVNGDGKIDFISCAYFSKNVGWVENPGEPGKPWAYHEIDVPGPSEAAVLVDLTGDGIPEILPNTVNTVAWYQLETKGPSPKFRKFDFGTKAAGHGVGSGDVNGDGRVDLLTPKGWFEAPTDPVNATWTWHPEWEAGTAGIQMLAKDVDGDGLSDVVYGNGHDFGLFWLKQGKGTDGGRTWTKAVIDPKLSSVHVLQWADLNGDGAADELITGKRVYAHEIEPGITEGSVVGYYRFDKATSAWTKHVVFQGEPANKDTPAEGGKRDAQKDFPAGTAGTGLQVTAVDIDKDGDLDLVCPGKSGLYYFENLGDKP